MDLPPAQPSGPAAAPPPLEVIGPNPFAAGPDGSAPIARIGTLFPACRALVTRPGIHATQRLDFLALVNDRRRSAGQPELSPAEEEQLLPEAVDLIFEGGQVLIRPDPSRMDLAYAADELLAESDALSRRRIRFLFAVDPAVRDAVQARGENWRISPLPRSAEEMNELIARSRVPIREDLQYYYNRYTGTRLVTCGQFAALESLADAALARQLAEIARYGSALNGRARPEVAFFGADPARFGPADFAGATFDQLPPAELRATYRELARRFAAAVAPELRHDDPGAEAWRCHMLGALLAQADQTTTAELVSNLSPEFFLQIEWLPGGHSDEGEFILDPLYDELERHPDDDELRRLCDPLTRSFIFSYLREYGNLEYINLGRIGHSLSRVRPQTHGRRGVFLVQLKLHGHPAPLLRFIRMQKWGIRERLDEGKPLLQALLENEEYTDYVLDRRLGLRQLGMTLPPRIRLLRARETYQGANREVSGETIPVICFERDYLGGLATDKVPATRYQQPDYARRFAALLGRAAASNLIVGRANPRTRTAIFDDGDEVVLEDPATRLPVEIVTSDPSGSFADYQRPLPEVAAEYARPVNSRAGLLPDPREFAAAYLQALHDRFVHLQMEYRRRRRAFDHLFKHCRHDRGGSFAFRWECVLLRLDTTDAPALVAAIRARIPALQEPPAPRP